MKRTRRKNIFRGIRGSLNRFLSILFIVALGAGFMAGLAATSPDMYATADRYMDDCRWYDIDVKSTVGLTEADAEAMKRLGGVDTVQGARVMDMVLSHGADQTFTARVYALLDGSGETELNRFVLKEGRLPQSTSECVIQSTAGRYAADAPKCGDALALSPDSANYDALRDYIVSETLTIVGIVESPMCISVSSEPTNIGSGSIALDVYVMQDFYTFDYDTDVYLSVSGAAALDTFGEDYAALIGGVTAPLEALGGERAPIRASEVKDAAQTQLGVLESTVKLLEHIADTQVTLAEDAAAGIEVTAQTAAVLRTGTPRLAAKLGETASAVKGTLEQLQPDLSRIDSAKAALQKSQEALDVLGDGVWLIRTRSDAVGYSSYDSNVGKVAALAKIFPVFFFLVALLVALTTMTRLVEENRTQIGTLKALGFTNGQVLGEYLLYSLLSSVLGCALGFGVGFRLFPMAIFSAYSMMYWLPETVTPFQPSVALWVVPVTVCSILLATLWACWSEFRACPAALMQPKAPAAGKRIWLEQIPFIWNRLSFTHKVTARNLFRYKKRFFMTILGVAGCSALLVTGFGLRDSINDIVDKQFGEIYRYELTVATDGEDAAQSDETLLDFLTDSTAVTDWASFASEKGKVLFGGDSSAITLYVPQDADRFDRFVTLRERKTGTAIPCPDDGVVLTEKLCEELGLAVGDTVTLESADGLRGTAAVTGIAENYITSFAYLSPASYEAVLGQEPEFTVILCCLPDGADAETVTARALESDRVFYASSSLSLKETFADSIKSIDGVVLVLILAAGLLCVVVLYNLTNVNICERRKELATIRVLGFHRREVERYIFRETNILSFLGALVGLAIGVCLHSFVVRTVEVDQVMFGRSIYFRSYLFAMVISVVFTLLVNQIMRRLIRKVDMVEAMKAND